MQRPSHVGEYPSINMSRLYSRGDISLKIRDQTGGVRVPAVGAVAQVLEQLLQQKQITKGKRLIVTAWRHVASDALEGDKDLARGAFEVLIELRRERRRPAFGDCSRNASRVLVRRRGLWLGSAHHAASSNRAMLPSDPVSDSSKLVKSTTDFRDAAIPIRRAISRVGTPQTNRSTSRAWRTTGSVRSLPGNSHAASGSAGRATNRREAADFEVPSPADSR